MPTQEAELTPRARAKRDQIRQAAQHLFLRDGFAATSTDALAAEAGISKQTLYAYYASKEDLLADVLQQLIEAAAESAVSRRRGAVTTEAELRRATQRLAEAIVKQLMQPEYLGLLRVVATETPRFPNLGERFRQGVLERLIATVASLLDEARAAGLVEASDAQAAARMLVGPLLTYVLLDGLLRAEDERRAPSRKRIEKIVELFLKAVARS